MKIGVSSYSYSHYMQSTGADFFEVARLAKEQGFDAIEFLPLTKRDEDETLMDTAAALRRHCEELGIEICAYTIGADLLNGLGVPVEDEPARLKGCVDVCKALGAPVMRHDVAWKLPEGMTWEQGIEELIPRIREVTEYAAQQGIRTCTENHGFIYQDSSRVKALIDGVNHPNYGWLVDIGNFICADEDHLSAVRVAAPYAFHVHAKDFLRKSADAIDPGDGWFLSRGGQHIRGTVVGHGVVPVKECLDVIRESGYQGVVSLEFEGMEENLPAVVNGLAYLRRVTA
ncbi:MAG: sugar phosphate isomerase/epimerase [Clostridia bacterium]|nr:sugar phosphate isomerase/epimerase [Clostridia bacterium]